MSLQEIVVATTIVSLVSMVGISLLILGERTLKRLISAFVSFAAGALIGVAVFDLLPESLEFGAVTAITYTIFGVATFFIIERFFYWHHHHTGRKTEVHAYAYLNLIGDSVHNFLDGAAIAIAFVVSPQLGFVVTLAVILHEIPQELGDFIILIQGGFSVPKAIYFNFMTAAIAIGGAVLTFFFSGIEGVKQFLIPFSAGGLLYIALVDLLPQLIRKAGAKSTTMRVFGIALGVAAIFVVSRATAGLG